MKALKRYKTFMTILCIQMLLIGQVSGMVDSRPLLADEEQSYYYEAQELEKLGVFKGTNQGFELSREPSRLEALIMMMRMLGLEEDVLEREDSTSYFLDVPTWGFEYVNLAYERGLTQGVDEKLFGMERQVDAKMFITFMLRALNYDDKKGDFQYQEAVEFALDIGMIDEELKEELDQETFTRNYVAKIVFNTLNAPLANDERTLSRYLIDAGKLAQAEQTKGPVETPTSDNLIEDLIEDDDEKNIELTPIMGESEATAHQLAAYLLSKNPNPKINISVTEFAQLWIDEGRAEGVRGDIAFAQACHETGFFKFGGSALPEWNNYTGLGVTGAEYNPETVVIKEFKEGVRTFWTPEGSAVAVVFEHPQQGVQATIQHLKAYASKEALVKAVVDPRFDYVTRAIAPYFEDLGGKWAYPGYNKSKYSSLEEAKTAGDSYGHSILKKYEEIIRMK